MIRRDILVTVVCLLIAGCAYARLSVGPDPARNAHPNIIQSGQTGLWRSFPFPSGFAIQQFGIVVGPDKNMWLAEYESALFRVTMKAKVTVFPIPPATIGGTRVIINPTALTVGADGKFYMTTSSTVNNSGIIAVGTTTGSFAEYATPTGESVDSNGIVRGPDGNVWFPETSHIAKITPAGVITQYAYPSPNAGLGGGVAVGPDGFVWFTEPYNGRVGKIQPGSTTITEYKIPDSSTTTCHLYSIVNGGDGNLYALGANCVNADNYELLKVTTLGKPTAYNLPAQPPDGLENGLLRGPDGNIWNTIEADNRLTVFHIKKGTFSVILPPSTPTCSFCIITSGPDGNIWEAGTAKNVAVYLRKILTVTPTQLTFTMIGQSATLQGSETGNPTLTAKSSNTAVATVMPGASFNSFVVDATGAGSASVTVQDGNGNLFKVPLTVQ